MAVPEPQAQNQSPTLAPMPKGELKKERRALLMMAAAQLYGQGYNRATIARLMERHLITPEMKDRPSDQRAAAARLKLRKWERTQEFRDLVYQCSIESVDLETPAILKGIVAKAKRGRVDAARLALEVTGRHNPRGDLTPTQVVVAFGDIPRPVRHQLNGHDVVEGEVTAEEDG